MLATTLRAGRTAALLLAAALAAALALTPPAASAADPWVRWISSRPDTWIRSLDFTTPVQLYAASEGDGVWGAPSVIGPWSELNGPSDPQTQRRVRQVVAYGGELYAATSLGLFKGGGGGWTPIAQEPGRRRLNMGGIQAIHFNSGSDYIVGVASGGVYFTGDGGTTWDRATGFAQAESIFHFATGPGVIYAAGSDGVYASLSGGRSWTLLADGLPNADVLRVATVPGNPALLYAATSDGVYRSTNAGLSWNPANGYGSGALGSTTVRAMLTVPGFEASRLVAGTERGVWMTVDDGRSWGQASTGTLNPGGAQQMGNQIVWALGIGFTPLSLMAGTQAAGIHAQPLRPVGFPTTQPSISGTAEVGRTLSAGGGIWPGTAPIFLTYQWWRCNSQGGGCGEISGATGSSYAAKEGDRGFTLRVEVCAINVLAPIPLCVRSDPTAVPVAGAPATAPRAPPSALSITPRGASYPWGTAFTINEGTGWTNGDNGSDITPSFSYRWLRCGPAGGSCAELPGVATKTYSATIADVGRTLKGVVTATYAGGARTVETQSTLGIIERRPLNTDAPQVVGDAYVGRELFSGAGGWEANGPVYERQWMRCEESGLGCTPILNATAATYTPTGQDRGKRLSIRVTATVTDIFQRRVGTAEAVPSAVVTDPPVEPQDPPVEPPVVQPPPPQVPVPPLQQPQPPLRETPRRSPPRAPRRGAGRRAAGPRLKLTLPKRVKVGAKLVAPAKARGWKRFSYQWLRDGKPIRRATGRAYRLTRADRGRRISCRIVLRAGKRKVTVTTRPVRLPRR